MIYLKSVLAGIAAVLLAFVIVLVAVFTYLFSHMHASSDTTVGWDPFPLLTSWTVVIPVVIFCSGFLWEYRRLR